MIELELTRHYDNICRRVICQCLIVLSTAVNDHNMIIIFQLAIKSIEHVLFAACLINDLRVYELLVLTLTYCE